MMKVLKEKISINFLLATFLINFYIVSSWINSNYLYFRNFKIAFLLLFSMLLPTFIIILLSSILSYPILKNKNHYNFNPLPIAVYLMLLRSPLKKIFLDNFPILLEVKYVHYFFDILLFFILIKILKKILNKDFKLYYFHIYLLLLTILNLGQIFQHKNNKKVPFKNFIDYQSKDLPKKFDNKNIYFILLDSYAGYYNSQISKTTKPYFELRDFLKKNNFIEFKNFFTDGNGTKTTMPSFFNMSNKITNFENKEIFFDHHYFSELDIQDSFFIRYLKDKNYRINYIHGRESLIYCDNEKENCFPRNSIKNQFVKIINLYFKGLHFYSSAEFSSTDDGVLTYFMNLSLINKNQFFYIHFGGPGHAPHTCFPFRDCDEQSERKNYLSNAELINKRISLIVKKIVDVDPDSVIIITSDHGPGIYDRFNVSSKSISHFMAIQNGILFLKGLDFNNEQNPINFLTSKNLFPFILNKLSIDQPRPTFIQNNNLTQCVSSWPKLKKQDVNNVNKYLEFSVTDCQNIYFSDIEPTLLNIQNKSDSLNLSR